MKYTRKLVRIRYEQLVITYLADCKAEKDWEDWERL